MSVEQTPDNGFAILTAGGNPMGDEHSNCFIKTDEYGDTLFTKTNLYCIGLNDFCLTSDGGFLMVGGQTSWIGSFEMVKLNSQGDTVWTKYGGLNDVAGSSIIQTNDENYVISYGRENCRIAKINDNGDSLWTRRYQEAEPCVIQQIIETDDEGLIMVGYDDNSMYYSSRIIKCDTDGNQEWIQIYDNLQLYSICQANNGDYLATGYDKNSYEDCVIRIDSIGNLIWLEYPLGLFAYPGRAICNAGNNTYVIIFSPIGSGNDVYLTKIDGEGILLWSESYGKDLYDVKLTNDNGIIATGGAGTYPDSGPYLVKTNQDGIITSISNEKISSSPRLELFPNPTSGTTNISYDFEVEADVLISIKNIKGQVIKVVQLGREKSGTYELNCEEFSRGIYLVSIKNGLHILAEKLVVE